MAMPPMLIMAGTPKAEHLAYSLVELCCGIGGKAERQEWAGSRTYYRLQRMSSSYWMLLKKAVRFIGWPNERLGSDD